MSPEQLREACRAMGMSDYLFDDELPDEFDCEVGVTLQLDGWRLQTARDNFNPASWRVDGTDGSVSVTRLQRPVDNAPEPE
jgi:hypothetical protein